VLPIKVRKINITWGCQIEKSVKDNVEEKLIVISQLEKCGQSAETCHNVRFADGSIVTQI
jgi:hypothetical protein